ncbi:hypothetical protein O6H91_16G073700 [Diphasiastrum complanatum]|uniref:Uncharacterized protein n=1 Tax=Diphasiastrum complanatum TaxID=34168 RepID=A0ACC2BDN1_DIPCM|nr:hypothetical protein O6H91_16G073700 [Diphasiastrum complanatum]
MFRCFFDVRALPSRTDVFVFLMIRHLCVFRHDEDLRESRRTKRTYFCFCCPLLLLLRRLKSTLWIWILILLKASQNSQILVGECTSSTLSILLVDPLRPSPPLTNLYR